jgi:uncharacterized protein (DUF362 family)
MAHDHERAHQYPPGDEGARSAFSTQHRTPPVRGAPSDEAQTGERFFPRAGDEAMPRPKAVNAKATVAIARTVERYRDHETIYALTKEAIDHLGGIDAVVKPGQSVLIKPNQTGYFLADEGMMTDPRFVSALIRVCREAGAHRITVGESSRMDDTKRVMQATGMTSTARAAGAEVVSFDDCAYREVDVPRGKALRRIALPVPVLEADVIINACKGKTHHMDPITGAIKNWVGLIGLDLRQQHHDVHTCAEYVDIMTVVKPTLNVCDAIVVGEGDGPVANTPRWCGCVLASTDPVAMDVTISCSRRMVLDVCFPDPPADHLRRLRSRSQFGPRCCAHSSWAACTQAERVSGASPDMAHLKGCMRHDPAEDSGGRRLRR